MLFKQVKIKMMSLGCKWHVLLYMPEKTDNGDGEDRGRCGIRSLGTRNWVEDVGFSDFYMVMGTCALPEITLVNICGIRTWKDFNET